jgi:tetratricopeptide (TPR) repeat protein
MNLRMSLLTLILLAGSIRAAEPDAPTIPIPEQSATYGWAEAKRILYKNTPLMRKGIEALRKKDYARAESAFEEALVNDPANNHAKVFLVDVYEKRDKPEKASALCDDLIARYPDYLEPYLRKAFIAFRAGDHPAAIAAFEHLLSRAPADYPRRGIVERNLAQLYFLTEAYDRAREFGERWLQRDGGREARLFLAECAIKTEDWGASIPHLDAVLVDAPAGERGDLLLKRGFVLANAERFEDANKDLQEAQNLVADKGRRLEIEQQLGFNAMKMKAPGVAAGHFKACLLARFDEKTALAYMDALTESAQWDLTQVEGRALLKNPALSPAGRETMLTTILYAHRRQQDDAGFLEAAQQLFTEFPKPLYLVEAAAAARRLGRDDDAIRLYRQYLDLEFDPKAALDLHYLLKKADRLDECADLLERVLAARPEDSKLRHAALYELAQVRRARGESAAYFDRMGQLIGENPEANFYHEYAVQLYGGGHYEEAAEMFIKSLEKEADPKVKFRTCKTIADIQLVLKQSAAAKTWLQEATKYGEPDLDWQLGMARADYQLEDFPACVGRLLPLSGRRDVFYLYIGFSFYRMGMPGLALINLNQVAESDKLTPRERYNLFANRAYLHFDQDQNEAALADLDRALGYEYTPDLALVKVKTLIRMRKFEEAILAGEDLLRSQSSSPMTSEMKAMLDATSDPALRAEIMNLVQQPDAAQQADVCQHIGLAHFRLNQSEDANRYLTQALDLDASRSDVYYLRGLSLFKQGKYKEAENDFLAFYDRTEAAGGVPDSFWGDLGVLEGDLGDYDLGTAALAHASQIHPQDIDSLEEAGYQQMKWRRNREAKSSFTNAIALYNQVTPYLKGEDAAAYEEDRAAMKREYGALDKTWGLQGYFGKSDFNNDINTPVQTIDGALPSQAGISGSWRPPEIGFRDQKTLDVFGRVLANFEDESSWTLDDRSFQGGIGVVYKPLTAHNLNVSFERLIAIGDDAEDNWLWRNLYSWERGEKPQKDKDYWWYSKIYGEVSYFLEEQKRWIYYLDGRLGLSLPLARGVVLTLPQGLAIGRYQSEDDSNLGTYAMLGLGGNVRLLEREKEYTIERWYLDAYGYYVWGWFEEEPEDLSSRDFEGVIFGLNFVK